MPATLEEPVVETKNLDSSGQELYEPAIEPETPIEAETTVDPVETPEEEPTIDEPVVVTKPTHSEDNLAQAARLGIGADEIEEMTPKELARTIRHMNQFGQHVWDMAQKKQEPVVEEKKEKPVAASYDLEKNEALYPDEILETIRAAREMKKELQELKKQVEETVTETKAERIERVHQRIDGLISGLGDEVAPTLDRTTAKGKVAFGELLNTMNGLYNANKSLPEKKLFEMSIRALGISASEVDAEKKKGLEAKKEEFREGALAKPVSRGGPVEPVDVVRDLLKKKKMPVSKPQEQAVEWLD